MRRARTEKNRLSYGGEGALGSAVSIAREHRSPWRVRRAPMTTTTTTRRRGVVVVVVVVDDVASLLRNFPPVDPWIDHRRFASSCRNVGRRTFSVALFCFPLFCSWLFPPFVGGKKRRAFFSRSFVSRFLVSGWDRGEVNFACDLEGWIIFISLLFCTGLVGQLYYF